MIRGKSVAHHFRLVVRSLYDRSTAFVANTRDFRRYVDEMIRHAAFRAYASSRHTLYDSFVVHLDIDDEVHFDTHRVECFRLRNSPRETVENKAVFAIIGAEALFHTLDESCCSPAYIDEMHAKGRILFVNAEVYDCKAVISGGLTDDASIVSGPENGWGKLADMGFDVIQTDWPGLLKSYLSSRNG